MADPARRDVHLWSDQLTEPPCGTLEDRFDWTDVIEDVTCAACLEAIADGSGEPAQPDDEGLPEDGRSPAP